MYHFVTGSLHWYQQWALDGVEGTGFHLWHKYHTSPTQTSPTNVGEPMYLGLSPPLI